MMVLVTTKEPNPSKPNSAPKKETFRLLTYQGSDIQVAIKTVIASTKPKKTRKTAAKKPAKKGKSEKTTKSVQ